MVSFTLTTRVQGRVREVYDRFGPDLLRKLTPPLLRVEIREMTHPIVVHSAVVIEVTIMGLVKQHWHNQITEVEISDEECRFVDEGIELPGMFHTWRHRHRIVRGADGTTQIVDEIAYSSSNRVVEWLIFPLVYLQFAYRKPIYRRYFREKGS